MVLRLVLLIFIFIGPTLSCGSRDLSRADGRAVAPDPLSGLEPDLFFLRSKNSNIVDVALRQVSEDFSNVVFTDVTINLSNLRVSFENESVGELSCALDGDVNTCDLTFYEGVTAPFTLSFQESYSLKVIFQPVEGFVYEDAPASFASGVCDNAFGTTTTGEKLTLKVLKKEEQEELVNFFFYDFGFQNQGQLATAEGAENTSLHYSVNFDQFYTGPYTFSGVRKSPSEEISYLEVQAIQSTPVFKRTLVCFND